MAISIFSVAFAHIFAFHELCRNKTAVWVLPDTPGDSRIFIRAPLFENYSGKSPLLFRIIHLKYYIELMTQQHT